MGVHPAATDGATSRPARRMGFSLRDNTHGRILGLFATQSAALAFLAGRDDGYYSINDGSGGWCEVQLWKGERFVRSALMTHGAPTPFVSIEPAQ